MTNRVRKGNDVRIRWRVDRLGEPVNLEEVSIKVELIDRFRRSVPVTFSVEGNVVIIDFAAANQKTNGGHTAVLIVSDGYTTSTVDKCNIIDLVEHSCEECCLDVDAEGRVWIDVASNLVFPANGKDGIGIDSIIQTESSMESEGVNRIEITLTNGEKTSFEVRNGSSGYTPQKGKDYFDGKSLYDLLVEAGMFTGSLEEFLAAYEKAFQANAEATKSADEAARTANAAASNATNAAQEAKTKTQEALDKVDQAQVMVNAKKLAELEATKQDKLVSGTNIKTINGQSITGEGNINIEGGGGSEEREPGESMGYVVLSKDKTFAEQVTKAFTIYEVRDKFDIAPQFTMPSNCVLKFNGGSLSGSIVGDNTSIDAAPVHIFESITFSGTFTCNNVPAEWFGAKAYGFYADKINEVPQFVREGDDSSTAINEALNLANICGVKAILTGRYYKIENSIIIPRDTTLYVSPHTAICPVMSGSGDSISISDKSSLVITECTMDNSAVSIADQIAGGNVTKVVALRENEFITTSAMAKAVVMQPQGSRIEGRGYLLMRAAQYCIGIYMKGVPLESTDMATASFMDIKITDGSFGGCVHDVIDLYGSGVPSDSFGEDGEWYIDIANRVRYKKASGAWAKNPSSQGDAGGQWDWRFNTHVRLEVLSPGTADQRIVNLDAELWSTGGFRGIEMIASPSKSWINSTFWRGTNSNKEGGNYFFFGAGSFADHDFRQMNVQMAGSSTNGYRVIYGKPWQTRFGYVWDLHAGNASLRYKKVIELLPSSAYNEFDCNERTQYVDDQGKYNRWSYLRHHPYQQDDQAVGAFSFYNLLEGRTPLNAKLFFDNETKPNYKTWSEPFTFGQYAEEWDTTPENPVEFPSQLFDCDFHTYSTAIDTTNGLHGVSGLLSYMGSSDMNILRTSCMKWLAIEYRLYGASTAFLYIINGERTNTYKLRAEDSLEYKGTGITTQYFPVSDSLLNGASYEQGCKIGIAISANDSTPGQILDIVNIRLISTAPRNFRPQYASYMSRVQTNPRFGTTANRPNAVSTGWMYYDTTLAKPVVNIGGSSNVIWDAIGGGYEPPQGGIPKKDLAKDIQDTLDKVDEMHDDYTTALNLI